MQRVTEMLTKPQKVESGKYVGMKCVQEYARNGTKTVYKPTGLVATPTQDRSLEEERKILLDMAGTAVVEIPVEPVGSQEKEKKED